MSGPQFIHIETYARSVSSLRREREYARAEAGKVMDRKLSVEEICGEAGRLAGHHPHIAVPCAPRLLMGIPPGQVPGLLDERVALANNRIKAKKAALPRGSRRSGPRAIRADTHTLLTIVTSYPVPWENLDTGERLVDDAEQVGLLDQWRDLNISFAAAQAEAHGFTIVSGVEHSDETYPHLHFLAVPGNERMEARACHPGYLARDALDRDDGEDDKAFKRRKNAAYKKAMRAFQDDYYEAVSIEAGLVRTGPKRSRVTRGEWIKQKEDARLQGLASLRAKEIAEETKRTAVELDEAKSMLETTSVEAVGTIIQAEAFERERNALSIEVARKREEAADLDRVIAQGRQVASDVIAEQAELEKLRLERTKLEQENEAALQRSIAVQQHIRNRMREFVVKKRRELSRQKQAAAELAEREQELAHQQSVLDGVMEGIRSWADGRLLYSSAEKQEPFRLIGNDPMLRQRLIAVKPQLLEIIPTLELRLSQQVVRLNAALTAAITGWCSGLLQGRGENRADGQPTFHISETREGDELLKQIDPFRGYVARLLDALPDFSAIRAIKISLERLGLLLTQREEEEAAKLDHVLQSLDRLRRDAGRE